MSSRIIATDMISTVDEDKEITNNNAGSRGKIKGSFPVALPTSNDPITGNDEQDAAPPSPTLLVKQMSKLSRTESKLTKKNIVSGPSNCRSMLYRQKIKFDRKVHAVTLHSLGDKDEESEARPILLVGLSRGSILMWDIHTWSLHTTLTGGHDSKSAVTIIVAFGNKAISAASDGSICTWNLVRESVTNKFKVPAPEYAISSIFVCNIGSAGKEDWVYVANQGMII